MAKTYIDLFIKNFFQQFEEKKTPFYRHVQSNQAFNIYEEYWLIIPDN